MTTQELRAFNQYAADRIQNSTSELSLHELVEEWQLVSKAETNESLMAAIEQMKSGDHESLSDAMKSIRQELGLIER